MKVFKITNYVIDDIKTYSIDVGAQTVMLGALPKRVPLLLKTKFNNRLFSIIEKEL